MANQQACFPGHCQAQGSSDLSRAGFSVGTRVFAEGFVETGSWASPVCVVPVEGWVNRGTEELRQHSSAGSLGQACGCPGR